jgi:hypothetical protein
MNETDRHIRFLEGGNGRTDVERSKAKLRHGGMSRRRRGEEKECREGNQKSRGRLKRAMAQTHWSHRRFAPLFSFLFFTPHNQEHFWLCAAGSRAPDGSLSPALLFLVLSTCIHASFPLSPSPNNNDQQPLQIPPHLPIKVSYSITLWDHPTMDRGTNPCRHMYQQAIPPPSRYPRDSRWQLSKVPRALLCL